MGHAPEQPTEHHQLHDCRGLSSLLSEMRALASQPFWGISGICPVRAEAMAMWTEDPNPMFGNDLPHFGPV